uniref:Reverse transcriptase domain-containing protein n=1 Tax=Tanacetum cinerariifolium TaxID=118510 RepID=A0A6L2KCI3_TANCI|nr:reverse transcriptase domain-containing protein [Tanacetum cinerariifolium]
MRTHSSSNLPVVSSNRSTSNPKRRNRRRSKQPFILEESPIVTMADQRTMAELLRAPTEGYARAIVVPPILADQFELKHSLINMMTTDQFFRLEKDNPHDHIQIAKLTHAVNQQTSAVTTAMTTILKQFQATPHPASIKSVEEIYVTCGGAHPYYQCLAAGGNTFPELRDNIQGYVSAAAINYNQGNSIYRPPGMANQIRPPGFAQPSVQNNQNRFGQPQGFNRGNNFNPEQSYQASTQQNPLNELEKVKRMNEADMKAMQTQINMNMMTSLLQINTASTSGSGSLPSNTVANPKDELKSITTRSGLVVDGPTIPTPPPFINPEEDERVEETLTDPDLSEIAKDVFILVGKFTFPVDFVIVDYESDPRVPLILGRPFLRTARALIDVHGEKMILHDGDERLTLNMRHDTSSYSSQPQKESTNLINVINNSSEDFLEDLFSNQPSGNPTFSSHPELTSPEVNGDIFDSEGSNVLPEKLLDLDSTKDLHPPLHIDVESNLKEIEFLLYQDIYSSLKDLIDQSNRADIFVDSMPEMFTDEHAPDYSSPPIFDEYDDDFLEVEPDAENVYDDPFDSKGEKIKESKLLIDELDLLCDFLPFEYDSFISQDFSRVDSKPSTNNKDKLASSNASSMLEDFDPPFYEPLFFKEVSSIPENLKTNAEGFCPPVFIFSASLENHVSKSNRANVYLMAYLINGLRFT